MSVWLKTILWQAFPSPRERWLPNHPFQLQLLTAHSSLCILELDCSAKYLSRFWLRDFCLVKRWSWRSFLTSMILWLCDSHPSASSSPIQFQHQPSGLPLTLNTPVNFYKKKHWHNQTPIVQHRPFTAWQHSTLELAHLGTAQELCKTWVKPRSRHHVEQRQQKTS